MKPSIGAGRFVPALALLATASLGAAACGDPEEAEESSAIQSTTVERLDLRITAEATGSVEPVTIVEVKSKASGEILALHVDTGDRVESRTLLVEIDPRDVRNAHNQAQADLEVAEARLEIADAQLERSRELYQSQVITRQEFETANLEHANARAALVRAEANLELAEQRLGDVTIRAPIRGTIIQKNVEVGQVITSAASNVSGGTTLLVMANLDSMQVRTLVDETDMGKIRPGQVVDVKVEAYPDRPFRGEVQKIEPQSVVQQNITMFPVIVRLDNRNGLLKPGMNAEVEVLIAERTGVLAAPNNAIVYPQDVAPAAMVLGLDPENLGLDLRSLRMASRMRGGSGGGPPGQGAAARRASSSERESGTAPTGASGSGAMSGSRPAGQWTPDVGTSRPAVVFVVREDGTVEPRTVRIGVNDWDHTEIMSGVDEGEEVALIGAAQLQARQQEWLDRIRERRGGLFPGGGRR